MYPSLRHTPATILALLALLSACGDGADPVVGVGPIAPYDASAYTITVSVATTGPVYQGRHLLSIGAQSTVLEPNDTIPFGVPALGDHAVMLWLGPGCSTTDAVRTVPAGGSTHYDIACVGWGTVGLRAVTTGVVPTNGSHMVFVDGGWDWPSALLEPNGTSAVALGPGTHVLTLVPLSSCASPNADQTVEVRLDESQDVSFAVTCW